MTEVTQKQPNATGRGSLVINISAAAKNQQQAPAVVDGQPEVRGCGQQEDTAPAVSCNNQQQQSDSVQTDNKNKTLESTSTSSPTSRFKPLALVDTQSRAPFYELTRCVHRLYSTDVGQLPADDSTAAELIVGDLEYVQRCVELGTGSRSTAMIARLIDLGTVEFFQQLYRTLFHRADFFSPTSPITRRVTIVALGVGATLTDGSKEACRRLLGIDFQKDLFAYLRSDSLDPDKVKYDEWRGYIADCFLAILYNVIQLVTEARELYRDENSVCVFQRFRSNTTPSVSSMALILQSYVINEDENDVILGGSNSAAFSFLANELRSTFDDNDERRSENGYRPIELIVAINKLAVAEANQPPIVQSGVVDSYVRLMGDDGSVDEQLAVSQGLWTLASSCAGKLRDHPGCVEGLKQLLKTTTDVKVKRQADGALQAITLPKEVIVPRIDVTINTGGASFGDQVFISYNHGSRATVLRLRDRLKAAGFCVWVDDEGVFESIADDIIKGLDNAAIVLACMTQKYYESPYCKKEVVYAAESYKKIIPLTLEPRYNPHGWLRFHASDGLRYDFSNEENFEDSFKKLSQTLRMALRNSMEKTPDVGKMDCSTPQLFPSHHSGLMAPSTPVASSAETEKSAKSWTSKEVVGWLHKIGLQHLSRWFNGFDGEMLMEYKAFRHGAPETQAACYQDERQQGKMSVGDVIKLTRAFRKL